MRCAVRTLERPRKERHCPARVQDPQQPTMHRCLLLLTAALALLCCAATTADGHRYKVALGWSQTWSPPANATDAVVTLWGAGGGGASTESCGAGGGSGAAIMGRAVGDASWGVDPSLVQWAVTIGQGGSALTTPNRGGQRRLHLGGGHGAQRHQTVSRRGLRRRWRLFARHHEPAVVPRLPPWAFGQAAPRRGAVDDNPSAAPKEGAMIGDVKAGGAGAGGGYAYNTLSMTFTVGAGWTSPGRQWAGGQGQLVIPCYGSGGAAGFNGNGGDSQTAVPKAPLANSGSGGGSAHLCYPTRLYSDSNGAAGGVLVEYTHPVSPVVAFKSSVSGKYLTAHSYSGVSAAATAVQAWERWTAIRLDNGKYVFRSWQNKHLRANPTDSVDAGAAVADTWEQFEAIDKGGDRWSLKNHYGKYVVAAADGFVYSDVNADHVWQVVLL